MGFSVCDLRFAIGKKLGVGHCPHPRPLPHAAGRGGRNAVVGACGRGRARCGEVGGVGSGHAVQVVKGSSASGVTSRLWERVGLVRGDWGKLSTRWQAAQWFLLTSRRRGSSWAQVLRTRKRSSVVVTS